jgi:hypothetical protein
MTEDSEGASAPGDSISGSPDYNGGSGFEGDELDEGFRTQEPNAGSPARRRGTSGSSVPPERIADGGAQKDGSQSLSRGTPPCSRAKKRSGSSDEQDEANTGDAGRDSGGKETAGGAAGANEEEDVDEGVERSERPVLRNRRKGVPGGRIRAAEKPKPPKNRRGWPKGKLRGMRRGQGPTLLDSDDSDEEAGGAEKKPESVQKSDSESDEKQSLDPDASVMLLFSPPFEQSFIRHLGA